jgi:uncharacterized protein YdhG (YjbR/CyaY superfamily)
MTKEKARDVDSYIAGSDEKARPKLEELRQLIRSTIPNVEEKISWGVPFYRYHGALAGFAAYKNHVSLGVGTAELRSEDRKLFEEKGYRTGKKTLQIRFDQELPAAAIKQLLETQARKNEAESATPRSPRA